MQKFPYSYYFLHSDGKEVKNLMVKIFSFSENVDWRRPGFFNCNFEHISHLF